MAFGSWIKKIGEKIQSFGNKVKEKVIPVIEKGAQIAPMIEKFGQSTGIGGIETFGRNVGRVAEAANGWVRKDRELTPDG